MNINLNCPFNVSTSYGISSLNILESLSKLGHEVTAYPIGQVSYYPYQENILPAIQRCEVTPRSTRFEDKYCYPFSDNTQWSDLKSVRIYHQNALFEHVSDYHIGFPIFELDDFTPLEKSSIRHCNELIVCSEWAKGIINKYFPGMVCSVVPLGVDSTIFTPTEVLDRPFTFFYPGKFEYRKGFDQCINVFDKAFPTEDVEIIFLPQNFFIDNNEEWAKSLLESDLGKRGKVKIIPRLDSTHQVAELTNHADAVVSFSRAEGWNLPLLEALSCGKQVIATNYSGHTEFLNIFNSTLLDVSGREDALDGVFFHGQGQWLSYSESDIDNFVSAVRMVYKNGKKVNEEGIKTAKQFSWENSAKRLVEVLK